ncbi:MAG: hypothetical protein A2Y15_05125 [Clostridiales bacterium GWF2_36_10]|nr:MAG: hypothetical protein A2Y15_05125 [Clostridiales bacterium GWF2_36_10]HAN20237.1 GNAT family N-acetyltransferase [Clostridiales bacterium]
MNLNIRKAEYGDAEKIAYVHTMSWKVAYAGIIPDEYLNNLSVDDRAEKFRLYFDKNENTFYFLTELDEKTIGFIVLQECRDKDLKGAGEICAMYLLPEYFNKGYGSHMMRFSVNFLANKGYKTIALWVLEENARARKFYQKCGFVFDGKKKKIDIGKPLKVIRYRTEIRV